MPGRPFVIVLVDNEHREAFLQKYQTAESAAGSCFLITDAATDVSSLRDSLNQRISRNWRIDKQRIYLLIVGDQHLYDRCQAWQRDIFAAEYWLLTAAKPRQADKINQADFGSADLDKLMAYFRPRYVWISEIKQIESQHMQMIGDQREKGGWGIKYHLGIPQVRRSDSWTPKAISSVNLHGFYNLGPGLALTADMLGSARIPKPQSELQSQIFSQIDIGSILNGTADEQEIRIRGTFNGFVNLQAQLGLRKRVKLGRRMHLYGEVGLQLSMFQSFEIEIDTTILFDPSDLFSGGSPGSALGFDPSASGTLGDGGRIGAVNPGPFGGIGMRLNLGDKAAWDFSARYQTSFAAFRPEGAYTKFMSFQTGLIFRINQKRLTYYEYIRKR